MHIRVHAHALSNCKKMVSNIRYILHSLCVHVYVDVWSLMPHGLTSTIRPQCTVVYMLLKIVLPSTRSCGTKNRDVKGGVMEGAPMSPGTGSPPAPA